MADTTKHNEMFELAEQSMNGAIHLATLWHPLPLELICNLCQQAAEKYLKSLLLFNNIKPPRTHAVTVLLEKCEAFDTSASVYSAKCALLENYAVIPRYGFELQITEDDMRVAIRYAQDIRDFVKANMVTAHRP